MCCKQEYDFVLRDFKLLQTFFSVERDQISQVGSFQVRFASCTSLTGLALRTRVTLVLRDFEIDTLDLLRTLFAERFDLGACLRTVLSQPVLALTSSFMLSRLYQDITQNVDTFQAFFDSYLDCSCDFGISGSNGQEFTSQRNLALPRPC